MTEGRDCPICGDNALFDTQSEGGVQPVRCETCGNYDIDLAALSHLEHHKVGGLPKYLLSGKTRTYPLEFGLHYRVTIADAKRVTDRTIDRPPVAEQQLWVLRWLGRERRLGKAVDCDARKEFTSGFCQNEEEWIFLMEDLEKRGLLSVSERQSSKRGGRYTILSSGWKYIDDHAIAGTKGDQAFVAMWFASAMDEVYEKAIEPGVRAAGYQAKTIREHHFNDGIADRLKAEIRRSRFVIADYSGNRGGVYYEAGFAEGLGVPVINTCEESHLVPANHERYLHFDVRHLNIIDWKQTDLDKFANRIQDRIEGTIGKGPRNS